MFYIGFYNLYKICRIPTFTTIFDRNNDRKIDRFLSEKKHDQNWSKTVPEASPEKPEIAYRPPRRK